MTSPEAREEPGWHNWEKYIDFTNTDLQPEDCAGPAEEANFPRKDAFCDAGCGEHAITLNDRRLHWLRGQRMKNVLREILTRGTMPWDKDDSVVKIITTKTSLITCDGRLLPGYVSPQCYVRAKFGPALAETWLSRLLYVYKSAMERISVPGPKHAIDVMITMLLEYNNQAQQANDMRGYRAHDYFSGKLVRDLDGPKMDLEYGRADTLLNALDVVEAERQQ